jgi:ParB family chromosome partitioning protein
MRKQGEHAQTIAIEKLVPFRSHPFVVRDDEQMQILAESIRSVGILTPAIARPLEDGTYELIAGHRRKHACELLGIPTMPVIVRDISKDAATVMMVDSNLQREVIMPSEKAKAYKMKLEALKRQGARTDLTSDQVGQKSDRKTSRDQIAEESHDSSTQIQRYLRLNELMPELLQMVDDGKLALTPAVELSYLKAAEQQSLLTTIESEQATPSISQAQRMKALSRAGKLTEDAILQMMMERKKPDAWRLTLPMGKIEKYFPRSYTPERMEETILRLLEIWQQQRKTTTNRKSKGEQPERSKQ